MRNKSGFTFVELMTVIGILAVLLSIAIPNFIGAMPARRLESAAADIQSALQRARMAAVKENSCAVIEFISGNDNYHIFLDNGGGTGGTPGNACNKTQDADERTLRTGELPAGVDLISSVPSSKIQFNSRGFPDNGVTISFKNKNVSDPIWEVTLNITGSSRLSRG